MPGSGTRLAGTAEGAGDALVDGVVLAVDAVGVDLEEDGDAVPGPARYLSRRHAGVEPQRDGGVAQVVGAARQRGIGWAGVSAAARAACHTAL